MDEKKKVLNGYWVNCLGDHDVWLLEVLLCWGGCCWGWGGWLLRRHDEWAFSLIVNELAVLLEGPGLDGRNGCQVAGKDNNKQTDNK